MQIHAQRRASPLSSLVLACVILVVADPAASVDRTVGDVLISGPDAHDFGELLVGDEATVEIQFTNNSGKERSFLFKFRDRLGPFGFRGPKKRTLRPGQTRSVTVVFAPQTNGDFDNQFLIKISDPKKNRKLGIDTVPVEGTATGAALGFSSTEIDYGDVLIGSSSLQQVTITNLSAENAVVFDLGAGRSPFRVTQVLDESMIKGVELPKTLIPGESIRVLVRFKPKKEGTFKGELVIDSLWIPGETIRIPLRGNGVSELGFSVPKRVDFGMVAANVFHQRSFYLRNNGIRMLTGRIVTKKFPKRYFTFTGDGSFTLAPGEMRDITIQFGSRGNCEHDHPIKVVSDGIPGGKKSIKVLVESYKP